MSDLSAWHAPFDGRPWFPISAFPSASARGIPFEAATERAQFRCVLQADPASNRLRWFEWRAALGGWAPLVPFRRIRRGDLPSRYEPRLWRPVPDQPWPVPLPEPVSISGTARIEPKRRPRARIDAGDVGEHADPMHDGLRIGDRVPPVCVKEAETRVLRALRTVRTPGVVTGTGPRMWGRDSVVVVEASAYRVARDPDAHVDAHAIDGNGAAFHPEQRDLNDWLYALDWLRGVGADDERMLKQRARGWTFTRIARALGVPDHVLRRRYRKAVAALFVAARTTPSARP